MWRPIRAKLIWSKYRVTWALISAWIDLYTFVLKVTARQTLAITTSIRHSLISGNYGRSGLVLKEGTFWRAIASLAFRIVGGRKIKPFEIEVHDPVAHHSPIQGPAITAWSTDYIEVKKWNIVVSLKPGPKSVGIVTRVLVLTICVKQVDMTDAKTLIKKTAIRLAVLIFFDNALKVMKGLAESEKNNGFDAHFLLLGLAPADS